MTACQTCSQTWALMTSCNAGRLSRQQQAQRMRYGLRTFLLLFVAAKPPSLDWLCDCTALLNSSGPSTCITPAADHSSVA